VAVTRAARGYRVALVEQRLAGDTGREHQAVHGGVRYLQQARFRLVHDALRERGRLCRNAPHLVHPLPTIVPLHSRWEGVYYGFGMKVYERMSGKWSLGPSRRLSLDQAVARFRRRAAAGCAAASRIRRRV
jgi:glycerol-3-phosphate dehydrogenase